MNIQHNIYSLMVMLVLSIPLIGQTQTEANLKTSERIPAPLFRDPVYDGAADPEIVWNCHAKEWWVFYTGRRATKEGPMSYAGNAIGIGASRDWKNWRHVGYCKFNKKGGVADSEDTFWAPSIVFDGKQYHMFVVFKKGCPIPWSGKPYIVHYVAPSDDLLNGWKKVGVVAAPQDSIDAGVFKVGEEWRMWLKNRGKISVMTSKDLLSWKDGGMVEGAVNEQRGIEGPYVFFWKESYWMITDPHNGIQVYKSKDADKWEKVGTILEGLGVRPLDITRGRHPSAVVIGGRAFIMYHVEPYRPYPPLQKPLSPGAKSIKQKLCVLQAAEILYHNGKLSCDRNPLLPSGKDLNATILTKDKLIQNDKHVSTPLASKGQNQSTT